MWKMLFRMVRLQYYYLKDGRDISDEQLSFFATDEYRKFYFVARNMSTQSINVDKTSVFFYGVKRDDE